MRWGVGLELDLPHRYFRRGRIHVVGGYSCGCFIARESGVSPAAKEGVRKGLGLRKKKKQKETECGGVEEQGLKRL